MEPLLRPHRRHGGQEADEPAQRQIPLFVPHVSDVFAGVGVGGLLVTQDVGVVVVLPVRGAVAGAAVQARALVVHRHVSDIILSRYHQLIM